MNEYELEEQKQRAQAWYAILGLAALSAGAYFILRWIPNNPFNVPSEVPNTTRLNSQLLTGRNTPMVAAPPSALGSIASGCRVSDVSLVQEWRGPLRQTTTESIMAFGDREQSRGHRFDPQGWTTRAGASDAGVGCEVTFTWRGPSGPQSAVWDVSSDRLTVTATNPQAQSLGAMMSSGGRRRGRSR